MHYKLVQHQLTKLYAMVNYGFSRTYLRAKQPMLVSIFTSDQHCCFRFLKTVGT